MAAFQVAPPESFNFSCPEDWPKWSRCFKQYRYASGLNEKDQEIQVHTMIYTMGDEADDILGSFQLTEQQKKDFSAVKASHFVKRENVIYKRAKFNQRRQEEGETVDSFITAMYGLAEHCGYRAL